MGKISKRSRQIDIFANTVNPVAIDCKNYSRKIDVKKVEEFLGMMDDIGIRHGIIITTKGFSKSAYNRAKNDHRNLDLSIIHPDRLSEYQFIGTALIYSAEFGISFDQVDDWVIDTELSNSDIGPLMCLYPLGFTLAVAKVFGPFIYANIVRNNTNRSLDTIAMEHSADLAFDNPTTIFEKLELQLTDKNGTVRQALLRKSSCHLPYENVENALYVQYDGFLLLIVSNGSYEESDKLKDIVIALYEKSFNFHVNDK